MTTSLVDNGVNVEALLGARQLFEDNPDLGKTQWRSTTTWQRGTHSTSTIESPRPFCWACSRIDCATLRSKPE